MPAMGASVWGYHVQYQPDLPAAFEALQAKVLAEGDYWWEPRESVAGEHADRPRDIESLFSDEEVQTSGTHSILDMDRVLAPGEEPRYGWLASVESGGPIDLRDEPEYGTVAPVTADEARAVAGVEKLTRDHVEAVDGLAEYRGFGRCAILHDAGGKPTEIYFWGHSGD
jgi:hypothetical protein